MIQINPERITAVCIGERWFDVPPDKGLRIGMPLFIGSGNECEATEPWWCIYDEEAKEWLEGPLSSITAMREMSSITARER